MTGVETQLALHIVHEPKVYLVGRQMVDDEALERVPGRPRRQPVDD